jgi:microcystin synthetase protein McyG
MAEKPPLDYASLMKQALLKLEQAEARIRALEHTAREPLAVVGMSCRFPGAPDLEAFERLLEQGLHAIREVPADRWDLDAWYHPNPDHPGTMTVRHGGFVEDVDQFDPRFFGISANEAQSLDPQQRMLLEVTWHALEDAGLTRDQLRSDRVGVFVGICSNEYGQLIVHGPSEAIDPYVGTGNASSVAAGRLAYFLDLDGPCLALDTACSSSLVTVHLAAKSLRTHECRIALAGGVNLLLAPKFTLNFARAGMLAPDGRCKTFDDAADGYVRAEGCGMLVLKRLSDALADGDRIHAVVLGSAINADGRSGGLTVPNGAAQQDVMRRALAEAGLEAHQVQYVEAHGTGTPLGDPIELAALQAVYGQAPKRRRPLAVGSVKTNIGHLEGAAGVAGTIKVILAMRARRLPRTLHFDRPSSRVEWHHLNLRVVDRLQPWPAESEPLRAGVSAFGFSGTNAHVLLEEPPEASAPIPPAPRLAWLLALSARCPESLRDLAVAYASRITDDDAEGLTRLCAAAYRRRRALNHRLVVTAAEPAGLRRAMEQFAHSAETGPNLATRKGEDLPLAFLFSGQGAQYARMGRQLDALEPTFRDALDECDALAARALGRSLRDLIHDETAIDSTVYAQPVLFSIQVSLVKLLASWGIEPSVVLGHSVGEIAAAWEAGVLSLEDAMHLAIGRGRAMGDLPGGGAMACVFAAPDRIRTLLGNQASTITLAAFNGPKQTVLSGSGTALESALRRLAAGGLSVQKLAVSHAFHSPLMDPALPHFERTLSTLRFGSPDREWISTLTGQLVPRNDLDPAYWLRQVREPVRFEAAMTTLLERGPMLCLEIGPRPVLLAALDGMTLGERAVPIPSLRRDGKDQLNLMQALGQLFLYGYRFDPDSLDQGRRATVSLPRYPFRKERYWVGHGWEDPASASTPRNDPSYLDQLEPHRLARVLVQNGSFSEPERRLLPRLLGELRQLSRRRPADDLFGLTWRRHEPSVTATVEHLAAAVAPELPGFLEEADLERNGRLLLALEDLAAAYAHNALCRLGWLYEPGQSITLDQVAADLAVIPKYRPLLRRLLVMADTHGRLTAVGDGWRVMGSWEPVDLEPLLAAFSSRPAELRLLHRCGPSLDRVLRGRQDPIPLLFPDGDLSDLTAIYRDSGGAVLMNRLLERFAARAVGSVVGRAQILEVGAGTGGATSNLLPALAHQVPEYWFTDVSPVFLEQARESFAAYDFVRYGVLDLEDEPEAQGFQPGQFHLVVATNVLHATRDLAQTLARLRRLLKPGGLLMLQESLAPLCWLDLTFGLTDGWWLFGDHDLRPHYPLISRDQWLSLLRRCQLEEGAVVDLAEHGGDIFHQAVILAKAPTMPTTAWADPRSVHLVLEGPAGDGRRLAARLAGHGRVILASARPGIRLEQAAPDHYLLDPREPDQVRGWIDQVRQTAGSIASVTHVLGLDPVDLAPDVMRHQSWLCGSVLNLVQSLAGQPCRLLLVTTDAIHVLERDRAEGCASAPLWGLGKVIPLEHPELQTRLLDLDTVEGDGILAALEAEWRLGDAEQLVAWRRGTRYTARLCERLEPIPSPDAEGVDAGGCYAISGGLGGLGMLVAEWLVNQGAGELLLIGRQPPDARMSQRLEEWRTRGTQVLAIQADVNDREELGRALRERTRPLRGIVHAAGVLDDAPLVHMDWPRFERVLAPKVAGLWNLHQASLGEPLSWFVIFSSAIGLLGNPGQANHAAACTFAESFAYYRHARGLPALCIDWGAWDQVGAAARRRAEGRWTMAGVRGIPPERGLALLGALLNAHAVHVAVLDVDWRVFRTHLLAGGVPPHLCEIVPEPAPAAGAATAGLAPARRPIPRSADPGERGLMLHQYLVDQLALLLGFPGHQVDPDLGLNELGMDSLMAVRLRNRVKTDLDLEIPTVTLMENPNIRRLADLLRERWMDSVPDEIVEGGM